MPQEHILQGSKFPSLMLFTQVRDGFFYKHPTSAKVFFGNLIQENLEIPMSNFYAFSKILQHLVVSTATIGQQPK